MLKIAAGLQSMTFNLIAERVKRPRHTHTHAHTHRSERFANASFLMTLLCFAPITNGTSPCVDDYGPEPITATTTARAVLHTRPPIK